MTTPKAPERSWTTVDKSAWARGPWDDEPDKVVWIDPATGLDCMIHRNYQGGLCGYVGVPPGHRYHRASYAALDPPPQVHGGLNFADLCDPAATEEWGLCHVPADPSRPHDVWWFGFDCGHMLDTMPSWEARMRDVLATTGVNLGVRDDEPGDGPFARRYRDLDYVRGEVSALASQLA